MGRSNSSLLSVRAICAVVVMLLVLGGALGARAEAGDIGTKFKIDSVRPEASVPTPEEALKNPLEMGYLVMDLLARAETARQRGDYEAEARYYRAIVKAVPARAVGYSKLCRAYEAGGKLTEALQACKTALGKGGVTVDDHVHFVTLALSNAGPLSAEQIRDIDAVIDHLGQTAATSPDEKLRLFALRCQVGARLHDVSRLESCTKDLTRAAPNDPRTITFAFALGLARNDESAAAAQIASAEAQHLPQAVISNMKTELSLLETTTVPSHGRSWLLGLAVLALALMGGVLLLGSRRKRARATA